VVGTTRQDDSKGNSWQVYFKFVLTRAVAPLCGAIVANFVDKIHCIKQAQANHDGEASKRNKNHRIIGKFLP
jgi:hypothetical protein